MKKFLRNPWVQGIGTTVIGGILLSLVLDWINGVDWLSTIKVVIKFIFNAIITFLNFRLKVWWVLAAIALVFASLYIIAKIYDAKPGNKTADFLSYTKDSVLGYTWEWEYTKTYDGKYTIHNLHPVCSKCGMILKQSGPYGFQMDCLRCNKTKEWKDSLRDDAQMLIEDNIRNNYIEKQ